MPTLSLDPTFRTLIFADTPAAAWGADQGVDSPAPWNHFARAREALQAGRSADAIAAWQKVIAIPDLDSRHYLQAWHLLRSQRVLPPSETAKTVLGVVVEAGLDEGIDIVAAYADLSARYINFSGASIIWEHPDSSLDSVVRNLLQASSAVVQRIGPIDGPRPGLPGRGNFRLNFLTPLGLHYGEGPMGAMQKDGLAGPVVAAALELMSSLIDKSQAAQATP
jgi:hypothetical protein